jgi:inorganic pyrophosphatase
MALRDKQKQKIKTQVITNREKYKWINQKDQMRSYFPKKRKKTLEHNQGD